MSNWLRDVLFHRPNKSAARVNAESYRAENSGDFGPPGAGTCPVCQHQKCFGRNGSKRDRWYCFSSGHADVLGAGGEPVGLRGNKGFSGDILDLHAYEAGVTRRKFLRSVANSKPAAPKTATEPVATMESNEYFQETYEERLAVRIHDGGLPEPVAAVLARKDALQIVNQHEEVCANRRQLVARRGMLTDHSPQHARKSGAKS